AITVQEAPSQNYFQAVAYRILPADSDPDTVSPGDGIPLSSVALNCDILVPDDGAVISAGSLNILGYAFSGDGAGIARVDVSLDEGRTWRDAKLASESSRWAWRHWSLTVETQPGPLVVIARAWDTNGATQPESAVSIWNPKGYVNNSWARVCLDVTQQGA
ncbi:MAG: sulfite oxidase, partial [Mycobacterium sp.]|nr:sulfite oxidase [Mycobacterium sp.]